MALDTYSNLKAAIIEWSSRSNLAALLDDFIDLAETEMWKTLRIRDMETSAGITVTGRTAALPALYVAPRSIIHVSGGRERRIDMVAPQSQKIRSGAGSPANFTIRDAVEADRTITGTLTLEYYTSLTPLSSSNTSNGVLARFPDIYLFGSLSQVFGYAQDTEEEVKWLGKFEQAILGANKQDRDGRYLAPAGRVRGSTP
ncbi:MAG: hypothetical protein V3V74_02440 [Nitrosomonadaceae bacterium]